MGPVTAHITGKLTPHCGVFLGSTFAPETSINSLVAMRQKKGENGLSKRRHKEETSYRRREKQERVQLFNQLDVFKLIFACYLFEISG